MKYADFENIMSPQRMERYVTACGGKDYKGLKFNKTHEPRNVVQLSLSIHWDIVGEI